MSGRGGLEWVPHRPETWPWTLGRLRVPVVMHWWVDQARDAKGNPLMVPDPLPAGTLVRIVMVSRLGDVGITNRIDGGLPYGARVRLRDIEEQK